MGKVTEIQPYEYVGYYWWSDSQTPEVLSEPKSAPELTKGERFIIEAQLYCEKKDLSYSVKFVDDEYVIIETKLNDEDLKNYTVFMPNRMPSSIKGLRFAQRWEEKEDENCMGMKVLQPAEFVFVGFDK